MSTWKVGTWRICCLKVILEGESMAALLLLLCSFVWHFSFCSNGVSLLGLGCYVSNLTWLQRMKIALGSAKGLAFLHEAEKPIIFRDFKASNILLDSVTSLASKLISSISQKRTRKLIFSLLSSFSSRTTIRSFRISGWPSTVPKETSRTSRPESWGPKAMQRQNTS